MNGVNRFGSIGNYSATAMVEGKIRKLSLLVGLLLMASLFQGFAQTQDVVATHKPRVLLLTGIDYPGHLWRQTTPVLKQALEKDSRLEVFVAEDPSFLDSSAIEHYDLILLHFQTWQSKGPGEKARENLRRFVENGKGVTRSRWSPKPNPGSTASIILWLSFRITERAERFNAF